MRTWRCGSVSSPSARRAGRARARRRTGACAARSASWRRSGPASARTRASWRAWARWRSACAAAGACGCAGGATGARRARHDESSYRAMVMACHEPHAGPGGPWVRGCVSGQSLRGGGTACYLTDSICGVADGGRLVRGGGRSSAPSRSRARARCATRSPASRTSRCWSTCGRSMRALRPCSEARRPAPRRRPFGFIHCQPSHDAT